MVSGGPNLRLGHVAWGKNGEAGLRKAMGEIIPLKLFLVIEAIQDLSLIHI